MKPLLYDIAAMPGVALDYGYWSLRSGGLTDGDIKDASFAAASIGAILLASAVHPDRPAWGMATLAVLPQLGRLVESFHSKGWFLMLRLALVAIMLAMIGSIILSAPRLLSQDKFRATQYYDQEVRIRTMEINYERLNARLDSLKSEVSEIKENIIWQRNAMFTICGGLAIFLIKEFLILIKGGLARKDEP